MEDPEAPLRVMADLSAPPLQAAMVLTAVHIVVVTPEVLLETGVQEEVKEEVSGEAEVAAGKPEKNIEHRKRTRRGPFF